MTKIPVVFKYQEKEYKGTLDEVAGANTNTWHLMIDNYYWGRLRKVGEDWMFDESKYKVGDLRDYFAGVVISWYQ
jgi:hypothetical protein